MSVHTFSLTETLHGAEDEGQPGLHADHVPVVDGRHEQVFGSLA